MINLIEDFQIDTSISLTENINIPVSLLPKQYIDGRILVGKTLRCSIEYGQKANKGAYFTMLQKWTKKQCLITNCSLVPKYCKPLHLKPQKMDGTI
jgi:hypothetical protein